MAPVSDDHQCPWRDEASDLRSKLEQLDGEMQELKRRFLGQKSEKMVTIDEELRRQHPRRVEAEQRRKQKRRENYKIKLRLEKKETVHRVPQNKRRCPKCGRKDLKALGKGRRTTVYEYIPARFIKHDHIQETLTCRCGEYIVTAEPPPKAIEKGRYGAGFVAHVITAKCADSIPHYRLEKAYKRIGIPIARSTMTDLLHQAAAKLQPLADRTLQRIAQSEIVQADETSIKVQAPGKCRTGFMWTFVADNLIGYRFSPNRSGETPREVLGGTDGVLVVDGYTGYNSVVDVDGRNRCGCHAHVRRKFFDALPTAPEGKQALDIILDLYRVEHEAKERGIVRTDAHLALRKRKSTRIRKRFKKWLEAHRETHPPKSPFSKAVRYALNQWKELGLFLEDARIPLDNNASESALRTIALGRKNFLFLGNDEAGRNMAGLYSLIATCEVNGVNPVEYLTDVLVRIDSHRASRIDELLPDRWQPISSGDAVVARIRDGPAARTSAKD